MKVPCGGFDLDESVFNVDKNSKQVKLNSPISYDYMPEGYPSKDGWSVEWDGNTEGKVAAVGAPIYKFSDRVLSYEEFLSAMVVRYQDGGSYSMMVSETRPEQTQVTDAISSFICSFCAVQVFVIGEDNAEASGIIFPTKGLYTMGDSEPFKLIKETITPMSADFIPKNLNVVFRATTGNVPTSCNVTYDDLRGWLESNIPVLAVLNIGNPVNDVLVLGYIGIRSSSLTFKENSSGSGLFKYNSDGTFSKEVES